MPELSARARQVLYHCVTEYVATGEPVGSRTLAKKSGLELSPASIRNVLADLEEAGYLRQPHTSAGRVPTDRAFRLFIDALMHVRELTGDEEASIRDRFASLEPGQNVMRETGKLLSELTGTVAVVVAPRAETLTLKQLRFLRTAPEEVLAVIVMKNGTVQNRFLKAAVTEADLRRIHDLLDDVVEGRTLGDLRELFERRLQSERVQHDELRRRLRARRRGGRGGGRGRGRPGHRGARQAAREARVRRRRPRAPPRDGARRPREARQAARPRDAGQERSRGGRRGGRRSRHRRAGHRRRALHDARPGGGHARRHRSDADGLPARGAARRRH